MKNTRTQKGITLIALIITIVVLLILAVVAIRAVQGDSIIEYAQNARDSYQGAQDREQVILQDYLYELQDAEGQETEVAALSMSDAQGKVLSYSRNVPVLDDYGNKIVVPAGFKITTDASNVTQGIVIEDCTDKVTKGSQFVWIPVGTVKTDKQGTTIDNPLERYSGSDDQKHGSNTIVINYLSYHVNTEETSAFVSSVASNGGYYIGRYEARTAEDQRGSADKGVTATDAVTCKATDYLYNYVKYADALRLSKEMYTGTTFSSNLVNSYAWDTALEYFETVTDSKTYSDTASINQGSEEGKVNFCWKGTVGTANEDKICNVYDMASNSYEWSTEIHIENDGTTGEIGVVRGGWYSTTDYYAGSRELCTYNTEGYHTQTFRVVLYV